MRLPNVVIAQEQKPPEIIGPQRVQIHVCLGETTPLHCIAFTNCHSNEALIYWIVNESFPEDTPNSDRMVESAESILEGGAIVHRSLLLKNITSEDLVSTFTCVVANPLGIAKKYFQLTTQPNKQLHMDNFITDDEPQNIGLHLI